MNAGRKTPTAATPRPADSAAPSAVRSSGAAPRDLAKIEQAYQQLKRDIMDGVYSANERLVEAPLARVLNISRNTLRTVMARLEYEGLVVLEPNRGGRVRSFSLEEAHDVLRVREAMESLVARLAAERATDEQRAGLRSVLEATEQALKDDDIMRYTALNREFHARVIEAARSPKAASVLESLHFPLVKYQFQAVMVPGRKADSLAEHHDLTSAIVAGDPEAAERSARLHIQQVRATLARSEELTRTKPAW
ncbi:GntR family transcriptional regulator [Streptomyces hyderabadensis]|uniref:GntR family transcriptional regulator n=1 Tax=Streptomyces hyderabadensis TaxID=598549 RepID=A0ABP9IN62_9ACTN|nr:GntR family transcriptional regulator [Streptomyces hyderabadensis]